MLTATVVTQAYKDRLDRHPVRGRVQARRGNFRQQVEVLNISASGAHIRSVLRLDAGAYIWLRLPGLEPLHTKVVWVRGFEAGCQYAQPLHDLILQVLLESMNPD